MLRALRRAARVAARSTDQWLRASRRWKPHTWQYAIPVVGSTSRKLAQPFVAQKSRPVWAALEAEEVRRRSRRMVLERPAMEAVAERESMFRCSFLPHQAVLSGRAAPVF